ncbi:leucine rich repeat protein [Pelagophyceae sp. CCMP2097]|nr:leucine rich repeat protein [Pelagophyceae sp. CCMP2097]|mmetsp:Transcript_30285/g.104589  ORF Transcript_30285/g.104589 Transcript_30285/m.104589 type:complete len:268 (-) Transcript_30285:52-855(-)
MEEYDELLPTADSEGRLELSYRAWTTVDELIWTMGGELVHLSLCYNRLTSIANEIGDLKLLQSVDVSCNQLAMLPPRLGALRHLRVLKCNGNALVRLPDLGDCRALEKIMASENRLVQLPRSLGNCKKLQSLLVQNNALEMVPPTLADVGPSLTQVDCRNNPDLAMLPKLIRGDTELILWVCRLHRSNEKDCAYVLESTQHLRALSALAAERQGHLEQQLRRAQDDRNELMRNLPTGFDRAMVVYRAYSSAVVRGIGRSVSSACAIS